MNHRVALVFACCMGCAVCSADPLYRETFDTWSTRNTDVFDTRFSSHHIDHGRLVMGYQSTQKSRPQGIECFLPRVGADPAGVGDAGTWGPGGADPAGAGDAGTWGPGGADPAEREIDLSFLGGGTEMSNSLFISYAVGPGEGLCLPPLPSRPSSNYRTGYIIRYIHHGDGANEIKFYRNDTGWATELKSDSSLPSNPVSTLRRTVIRHRKDGRHVVISTFDTGSAFDRTFTFDDDAYPPGALQRGLQVIAKGHAIDGAALQIGMDTWIVQDRSLPPGVLSSRPRNPKYRRKIREQDPQNDEALYLLGRIEVSAGNYAAANGYMSRSLDIRRRAYGPGHPLVAECLTRLAEIYAPKDPSESERLYQQALSIRMAAVGSEHPDLLDILNGLAALYQSYGESKDAIPLCLWSLGITEKAHGRDHPAVSDVLFRLGLLYQTQKEYSKAEELFKKSMAIREKHFGPDHPDVMAVLRNLEWLYEAQNPPPADAESVFLRTMRIKEKFLGSDHPDMAVTLKNLCVLYHLQGRYTEARGYCRRSVDIRLKALGPDHPELAGFLNNLAVVCDALGQADTAELLYRRSLSITEKALGPDHIYLAATLSNLGTLYYNEGRNADAESAYLRALEIAEKKSGADSRGIANILETLARFYRDTGKFSEARKYSARIRGK